MLPFFMINLANASETLELIVQATAVTGSCTPTLDNPEIDFGSIKYGTLSLHSSNELPTKSVNLTINCSSPMAVGWTIVDNHHDSVAGKYFDGANKYLNDDALAGLGKTSSGKSIGVWAISTNAVQYDGVEGKSIYSVDNGVTWEGVNNSQTGISFLGRKILSVSNGLHSAPVPFSSAMFDLRIKSVIAPAESLKLTDDTKINGSATISLVYL